jgi:hypothetical protein
MRRIAVSLSGLIVVVVGVLASAPAAFAVRVGPRGSGGSSVAAAPVVHHSGLGVWPISLIVVAGVIVVVFALMTVLARGSRRSTPVPA